MLNVPADRIAVHRDNIIDPSAERRRVAALFARVAQSDQRAAAEITASWPRLIHQLANSGALAAPAFKTAVL